MERRTVMRFGTWIGVVLGGAVLVLLLGIGAVLLLLQTQYGRDRVTGLVEDFTQGTSYRVRIEGLGGAPPWRMEIGRVEISDREGVWLTLEEIMVRWDVGDLFKRLYHFPLIQAERAHWQRLPRGEARDEAPRAEEEPLSIPELPSVIVSELRLQRVSIDEEVFGRAQELSVDGRLDADGNLSRAQLTIEGMDGAGDSLVVKVEHNPETDRLFVRFRVREDPGGLVGGLLGLDDSGPILALVRGEGPLEDWRGVFKLSAGGYGETEGEVRMSLLRALSLSLSGRAVVEEQRLPADAAALFGNAADFRVTLSRTADTLRLEEGVVKAGPVDLSMNGTMALEVQSLDVQINVTFEEIPGAVTKLLEERGIRLEKPGPVKGSIRGSLRQPEIEVDLTAARLAIDRADLARPRIILQGQLLRDPERGSTGFAGTARVRAAQLLIPELPTLSPVEGMLKLSTQDFEFFEIPQVTLSSPGLDVTGSGTLHREGWRTEGTIDVRISDPDKLLELGGAAVPERLHMRAGIKGVFAPPDFRLAVQATASGFGRWPEAVRAITGEQLSLSTEGAFARSVLEVSDFVLTGKAVGLRGSGQADLEQGRFSVVSQGALQDLSLLPGQFEGALTVEADARGGFDAFVVKGTARGTDVRVGGEPLTEPVSNFSLSGLPSAIRGDLSLTSGYRGQPVEASGAIALDGWERLNVRGFKARAPGLSLSGDLRADLEEMLLSGTVQGSATNLSFVAALTGRELAGQGEAKVEFTPVQGKQRTAIDLNAANLSLNGFSASKLTLSGRITDTFASPGGTLELSLQEGRLPAVQLTRFDAALSGGLDSLDFRARAGGRMEYPFEVQVAGAASVADPLRTFRIDALSGEYATLPFALDRPTTLMMNDEFLRLTELVLMVDKGVLRAEGELRRTEATARLSLRALPVEVLSLIHPIPARGLIEGDLLLSGPLSSPVLRSDFSSTLSIAAEETDSPPLQSVVSGSASIAGGKFSAAFSATGLGSEPFQVQLSFPALLRLDPFLFDVPAAGELRGSLRGETELQRVTTFLPLEGHALAGQVTMDLALDGTFADPLVQGRILLADGRYENYRLAMLVDRVNAIILAQGREFVLDSFRATDGERGRITATGRLAIDPDLSFPFETALTFRSFNALRTPELSTVASGSVELAGDARSAQASGELTLDPLRLDIPDRTAPAIAQLDVREINVAPGRREASGEDGPQYRVDLNLTLDFPARFYIRGRGLDAEFSGSLSVTGTSREPVIRGTLAVVRGDFTFLDRRFELTKASVIFTGATPPAPILDVTAEWSRQEITVLVRLTGSAVEPAIALESDPPLPSDEILSRVIFGRAVTDLTPLQALRLANALRVLTTGAGNGFDIFGTLRTTFGLDELEIREEAEGTALDLGRYLHENVYLRLSKGLGTGRDKVSVEIEVHEYISVESEVGTDSQGGIGINYRRNY